VGRTIPVGPRASIYPTLTGAAAALARHVAGSARDAVRTRGRFVLVVAGGNTPRPLYRELARRHRRDLPWGAVDVYFGDERCVGPRHPDSNYRMVREELFARVPIPRENVRRIRGETRPIARAAAEYDGRLCALRASGDPAFDLVLLGMGPDGHTASLFPGDSSGDEPNRWAVAIPRGGQPPLVPRISMTYRALASSREICFLVSGEEKAAALAAVLGAQAGARGRLPAARVTSRGPVRWYLDRPAAERLPSGPPARN